MIVSREEIRASDVALHYDELDRFYRELWGEHVHHGLWTRGDETREEAVRQLVQVVATEARIGPASRVCDIGCGYGATAQMLVRQFGAEVTGITISAAQHAVARQHSQGNDNPKFVLGDWLDTDFPDAAFDAAIAIESSEHMADKAAFFDVAHRVIRRGGRLVICAWLASEFPTTIQQRLLLEPICREGRLPHLGTERDYRQLAEAAGFQVHRFADVTRQIARTWPIIVRHLLLQLICRPSYIGFLVNRRAHNRVFAITIVRLWIAFRTGAMRYGVFTLRK